MVGPLGRDDGLQRLQAVQGFPGRGADRPVSPGLQQAAQGAATGGAAGLAGASAQTPVDWGDYSNAINAVRKAYPTTIPGASSFLDAVEEGKGDLRVLTSLLSERRINQQETGAGLSVDKRKGSALRNLRDTTAQLISRLSTDEEFRSRTNQFIQTQQEFVSRPKAAQATEPAIDFAEREARRLAGEDVGDVAGVVGSALVGQVGPTSEEIESSRAFPGTLRGIPDPGGAVTPEAAPETEEPPPPPPESVTGEQREDVGSGETGFRSINDALAQSQDPSETADQLSKSASILFGREITSKEAQEVLDFLGYDTAGQDAQAEADRLDERITELRSNFGMFNLLQIIGLILTRGKTADQAMQTFFAQQRIVEGLEEKKTVAARRASSAPKEVRQQSFRLLGELAERDIREDQIAFRRDQATADKPAGESDILRAAIASQQAEGGSLQQAVERVQKSLGR